MPKHKSITTGLELEPSAIKRILIIQTAFPGDVILTTPLISATKNQFPNTIIDFLTTPICENILETHPDVHQVIVFDKRKRHRGFSKLIRFAHHVVKPVQYDLALIPHRSLRSAILAWISRIPWRVGFDRSAGRFFLNRIITFQSQLHEVERNISLLAPSEIIPFEYMPVIIPTNADQGVVNQFLQRHQIANTYPMLTIAPGSVWETKKWLKSHFAQLCSLIHSEFRASIFLVGGKDDYNLCEWIRRNTQANVFNTAGRLTFRQSAELISRCQMLICNDSAPLHLGVAVQTTVIAIFGPTVPAIGFYPYGKQHQIVEKSLECRPCRIHGGNKCPINTFECMRSIKPEDVFLIIKRKLSIS